MSKVMNRSFLFFIISVFCIIAIYSFCASVFYKVGRRQQIVINIICYSLYFLVIVFRPIYLSDTAVYNERFHLISDKVLYHFSLGREPITDFEYFFVYLVQFSKKILDNFYFFNFIVTLLMLLSFVFATKLLTRVILKDSSVMNHPLFLLLFFPYFGLYYNAVVLRGGLALGLTYLAFVIIIQRKYVLGAGSDMLAFLFHRMGIIGWSIPVLYHLSPAIRSKKKYFICCMLITLMWMIEYNTMFMLNFFRILIKYISNLLPALSDYSNYLMDDYQKGVLFVITQSVFLLNSFYLIKSSFIVRKETSKLYETYLFGLIIMVIGMRFKFISRIVDYFLFLSVPLNYFSIALSEKKKNLFLGILTGGMYLYSICVLRAITYV